MPDLGQKFAELKEKVLMKKPVLREIMLKRGKKDLYSYAKEYIDINLNPPIKRRQREFINTFQEQTEKLLGVEIAASAAEQLKKYYYVSTVDHHGPICHPFFINGNLLTTAPYFNHPDPVLKNVIVLANGNVSLNNSSFPRGILFNSFAKGKIQNHRLSFFPSSERLRPVFNMDTYKPEDIKRVQQQLDQKVRDGDVDIEEGQKVKALIEEIYDQKEIYDCEDYSSQVTKTNVKLWGKFFQASEVKPPNLIYLEQESLVITLLEKFHLYRDTIINHILFDRSYDSMTLQYFENIQGAFSTKERWGTFLFWALPKGAKYRIQLWEKDNYLVSDDGSYKIEMTPKAISTAFQKHEHIPSMLLAYIVLSFYYGLKCLGGFNQVNYLTFMKNSYIKMQADLGNYRSIEVCARAQTKEMGGDFTLAFMKGPNGEMIPATGLDLYLYGDKNTWKILVDESKQITLEEGINPLMPEFYRILYTDTERDPELLQVTAEDITHMTHLDDKIRPCCFLKIHDR